MADKRERITATVELEDELSRPARQAASSVDELSDEVDELSASSAAATTQTNRLERALAALRRASGSAARDVDKASAAQKRWEAAAKASGKESSTLGKVWEKTTGSAMKFVKVLGKLMILPAITGLIVAAAGALSALGAAGFAAVAGLAPLVNLLGVMPALLGGLVTTFAAVKLGFKGIGDAAKIALDGTKGTAEQAAALRKLTPAGEEFVGVLREMRSETKGWSDAIQSSMLPGFSDALRGLRPVLPVVKDGLVGVGDAMGDLVLSISDVVSGRGRQLEGIFSRNERMVRSGLNPALTALTGILIDLMDAGGPAAERFTTWLGLAAERLGQLVDQGNRSGELTAGIDRAAQLAADVASVFGDIAVALYNTGSAAQGLASSMGGGFASMISDWRAWTESVEGQSALRAYFEDAAPAIDQVARMIKIMAQGFANLASSGNVADLLKQINDDLLPAIGNFASTVSSAIVPALVNLATAFFDAYSLINTTPIPETLMMMSEAALGLARGLEALPGPIKTLIVSLIALKAIAKLGGGAMANLATSMVPVRQRLSDVRAGIQLYNENVSGMRRVTATAQGAMAGFAGAGKGLMAALGGPWGLAIAGATIGLGLWAQKQADAKAHVEALTGSLNEQTGAVTDNTAAIVAKDLDKSGWLEYADDLGLSLETVTQAAMGNKDALTEVEKAAKDASAGTGGWKLWKKDAWTQDSGQFIDAVNKSADAIDKAQAAADRNRRATGGVAEAQKSATQILREKVDADRRAAESSDGSARANRRYGDAVDYTIRKVRELRNLQMESISAEVSYQQAKDDTAKALRDGARTLDINTQAGRDNVTAIQNLISSAAGLKNEAKRQDAIKEATKAIRRWGEESNISKDRINNLIERMIRTKEVAVGLDGTRVDVTIDVNSEAALAALETFRQRYQGLVGPVSPQVIGQIAGGGRNRREGGAVEAGLSYTVGEAGPELFMGPSGVEVIGAAGIEQRTFSEAGVVLPNSEYEAARLPAVERQDAPVPVGVGGGGEAVPDIHNHFHGDASGITEADVRRASLAAWRQFDKERRERR